MARCYMVEIDGVPIKVRGEKPPTDEDVEQLRELLRVVLAPGEGQ